MAKTVPCESPPKILLCLSFDVSFVLLEYIVLLLPVCRAFYFLAKSCGLSDAHLCFEYTMFENAEGRKRWY
jgi:hypothetical protein